MGNHSTQDTLKPTRYHLLLVVFKVPYELYTMKISQRNSLGTCEKLLTINSSGDLSLKRGQEHLPSCCDLSFKNLTPIWT